MAIFIAGFPNRTFDTIQEAINAANAGATIVVESGIYDENITINKAITLQGANAGIIPKVPDININDENGIDVNTGYRPNEESWIRGTVTVESSNVIINGFRLRNETGPLQWVGEPDNFQLLNNYVTGYLPGTAPTFGRTISENPIPTNVVTNWSISGNYIGGLLGDGGTGGSLYLSGLTDSNISNNTF